MHYYWCLIFVIYLKNIWCFNLDLTFPIIYTDPYEYNKIKMNRSSYFGYTLILYPGSNIDSPWIQIGAPRGNSPRVKFKSPGVVFRCGIAQSCTLIDLDIEKPLQRHYLNVLDYAWIGGSMDINYKHGRIVTCGYRWVNYVQRYNDYRVLGACYSSHINDTIPIKLLPLLRTQENRDVYAPQGSTGAVYDYGQGQAGFSINMPPDEKELLLGAPGVFNWHGSSILCKDLEEETPFASKLQLPKKKRRPPRQPGDFLDFADFNVASGRLTTQVLSFSLLGYSVTSGKFYSQNELLYVSSAPKSQNYKGEVLIHKFYKESDKAMNIIESKQGQQFGEYFGSSLTSGDINNDGLDDLIVGAPFFNSKKYNEGKIYVYLGNMKRRLQIPEQGGVIIGKQTSGQFGTAIQYLGDLDNDGYGDIAVAAPFEEDYSGVVYIYRGTTRGLDTSESQRIVGSDISPKIRGFGISISRTADIDANDYPDVAIGAYKSGHAVLLRTSPTVIIYHSIQSQINHLDLDDKSFQIQACIRSSYHKYGDVLQIERILIVDEQLGRATMDKDESNKTVYLIQTYEICDNITINLKAKIINRDIPITISLSTKLITKQIPKQPIFISEKIEGIDRFCPRCPIYDRYRSSRTETLSIPFSLDCGSDNICDTYLEFQPRFPQLQHNTFIVGSSSNTSLEIYVKNTNEHAYLTQVLVILPQAINFQLIPTFCIEQNMNSILCSIDNPLYHDREKVILLTLDMNNVNTGEYEDSLNITTIISTTSRNHNNESMKMIDLILKRQADITVNGKSDKQSYTIGNSTNGKSNFTQTYQVQKFGISPIDEILIKINIPHSIELNDDDKKKNVKFLSLYPPIGLLAGQPIICKSNFSYIVETNNNNDGNSIIDDPNQSTTTTITTTRKIGQITHENLMLQDNEFSENRTFYINCSMANIICSEIICNGGPIISTQSIGIVDMRMVFDSTTIKELMQYKDIVLYTTEASITILRPNNFIQSGNRPDFTTITSIFIGDVIKPTIATWIIIVSIIIGLLLLLLLVLALIKIGFFKRTTKQELEQLKQEMEQHEDNQQSTIEDNLIQETENE